MQQSRKRKLFGYRIVGFGLLFLVACQPRNLPEPVEEKPFFFVNGFMDQNPFLVEAGNSDYYMFTDYLQDENGVLLFRGELSKLSCPECPGKLQIELRDHELRENIENVDPNAVLVEGPWAYQDTHAIAERFFRVHFENISEGIGPFQYRWTFGDGTEGSTANPTHDFYVEDGTMINVCLEGEDITGCNQNICNEIILGQQDCKVDFFYSVNPDLNYVSFASEVVGNHPIIYRWDFGDGFGATLGNPGYYFMDPGVYQVCLAISDGNDCEASLCKWISTSPDFCTHNFTYTISQIERTDSLRFSQVRIRYQDENGRWYDSFSDHQPGESFFEILESTDYELNEEGQKTRAIRLRLDCQLYNTESGQSMHLKSDDARLALAYPG